MPVEKGIALLCGMEIVSVPLPSGDIAADLKIWADTAKDAIKNYDGLYIHIKGPDEPAHDGDFAKKKEIIAQIDEHFFAPLLSAINKEDYVICVTADHSTVCKVKAHTADPVPLLIYAAGNTDATASFSETAAQNGSLGELLGRELIYKLAQLAR